MLSKYQFKKLKTRNQYFFIPDDYKLNIQQSRLLIHVLSSFPHTHDRSRLEKLTTFDPTGIPENLLLLAANAQDATRRTVLGVAAYQGSVEAVKILINFKANIDVLDNYENFNPGRSALFWAVANENSISDKTSPDAASVVRCLIKNGAKITIPCYFGLSPYEYAIRENFKAAQAIFAGPLVAKAIIAGMQPRTGKHSLFRQLENKSTIYDKKAVFYSLCRFFDGVKIKTNKRKNIATDSMALRTR